MEGYRLTAVSLRDVSAEKWRDALEQLFLHDAHRCRSAGGRRGSGAAPSPRRPPPSGLTSSPRSSSGRSAIYRTLVLAERGELVLEPAPRLRAAELLADLAALFSGTRRFRERRLAVASRPPTSSSVTDASILLRVLEHGRNGLEGLGAGRRGPCIACSAIRGEALFQVHNAGVMAAHVQA